MLFDFFPLEKIIRCDTPCNNGGTCIGLEQCSCPKDYFGQHCTSKLLLCAYHCCDNYIMSTNEMYTFKNHLRV